MNAADSDTAYITVVIQTRNQHLRCTRVLLRSRDILDDGIHQVCQVARRLAPVGAHPPLLGGAVQRLEIQLLIRRVEVAHQVKDLFLHLVRTAVQFVHFVDNDNRFETDLQCLLQYETGLRHGALKSVNKQQNTVRHVQHALYLAAEICVSRSVDDVDFGTFVVNGDILRQNRNTALALQIIVVQNQLSRLVAKL